MLCNLSHVLSSSLMFFVLGIAYDTYGLRTFLLLISFFGLPVISLLFASVLLYNIDFPFTLLFFVDLLII